MSGHRFDVSVQFVRATRTEGGGCRVSSFTLLPNYSDFLPENIAEGLRARAVYPLMIIGNDAPAGYLAGQMTRHEAVAVRYRNCRQTIEGLTLCLTCYVGRCTGDEGVFFRGSDWGGDCGPRGPTGKRLCSVAYPIEPGLGVLYRFGRNDVDFSRLGALDKTVREAIAALRVPD